MRFERPKYVCGRGSAVRGGIWESGEKVMEETEGRGRERRRSEGN